MKLPFAILVFCLAGVVCFGQTKSKTTYLEVFEDLAKNYHLELSYSSDLVALFDSTEFYFSSDIDSCMTQLQQETNLKITKTETHLIVASKASAYIHIQGKVVDSESNELLPYANILIEKAGTGTITNTNGEFDFKIQGRYAGSEVQFSFLGYESQKLEVPFTDNSKLIIKLSPKPYTLADILVLPKGNEAVDIVKRAVKNIKRNYARNTFQTEAFYRNTNFRDTVASQLIEAALLIEDKGISKPNKNARIQLLEIRKSTNYLLPKSKKEKLWEQINRHQNIFYQSVDFNPVKHYKQKSCYNPLSNFLAFNYEFQGFEWLDSIKIYKIKYILDWNYCFHQIVPNTTKTHENENEEYAGFIYISADDWGIIKIEHWNKFFNELAEKWKLADNYRSKSTIEYQKINGKYYPKYAVFKSSPNGSYFVFSNSEGSTEDKNIEGQQWAHVSLLTTKIVTDRTDFEKIKNREKLSKTENSYKTKYPYNSEFWMNYNILKENPTEEKFIQEMEWEKSLNIQFEENSTRTNK